MPYGNFVEIEAATPVIETVAARLGLADAPRLKTSYLGIFIHLKRQLGLEFRDVTFDNFRHVSVPASLFHELA